MSKKTIVLSGQDTKKAVLTLEGESGSLSGKMRLYNFSEEPSGIISLGLYHGGNVVKAGLTREGGMCYTFKALSCDLPATFSCAVVNFKGGQCEPLLYGNSEGGGDETVYGAVIEALSGKTNAEEARQVLDNAGIEYDAQLQKEIDNAIEDEFEKNSCAKCKYREYYLANHQTETLSNVVANENVISNNDEVEVAKTFYEEIKGQVDALFQNNQTEEYLQKMIPSSKWVKVEFERGGDYYVLGLIYEENKIKFICYGVPGVYQKEPPKQLAGYPVWFPLDVNKREGFGYWLTYQDAESGESIKAIVE